MADRDRLAELESDWEKVSGEINPAIMSKYLIVRGQVKGAAVAAVNDAVCQGCNLNIPPQMYNELQRFSQLQFCPHCQRIIYWKES